MALFGISGKISSGKDLTGKIIQILTGSPHLTTQGVMSFIKGEYNSPTFHIKKFADSLKDIVCLLIGCTREQLEDQDFKNTELGEEWWYYKTPKGLMSYIEYEELRPLVFMEREVELIKPTPRYLLQNIGTDLFRNQLHPNIWVNALFSKYHSWFTDDGNVLDSNTGRWMRYPNWIITDLRFPNEMKAVEDRGGVTIRVNRNFHMDLPNGIHVETIRQGSLAEMEEHPSETALDSAKFKYTIKNDGSIEDLIVKVKEILILENII